MEDLDLEREYLKSILDYEPETGIFRWKESLNNRVRMGAEAGTLRKDGYRRIKINGKNYFGHRLAWLSVYGKFPTKFIDHINGDKSDNRITNLRDVTRQQNQFNRGKTRNNTSGYKGVSFYKHAKKFAARIKIDGKLKYLGLFDSKEEASDAYKRAAKELHGEYYNDNY